MGLNDDRVCDYCKWTRGLMPYTMCGNARSKNYARFTDRVKKCEKFEKCADDTCDVFERRKDDADGH